MRQGEAGHLGEDPSAVVDEELVLHADPADEDVEVAIEVEVPQRDVAAGRVGHVCRDRVEDDVLDEDSGDSALQPTLIAIERDAVRDRLPGDRSPGR